MCLTFCTATLKPRHVWFLLSWAEIHMNNLAVCQDIVSPTCSLMVWILAWWSSWKKTSKSLGPVTSTISRLASSPLLLLLHHASLLTRMQTLSLYTDIPFTGICGHSICTLMGERRLPISPLQAADCWEKAIRGLLTSGPVKASFWSLEGLWSVGKQQDVHLSLLPETQISLPTGPEDRQYTQERQVEEVQTFNGWKWF